MHDELKLEGLPYVQRNLPGHGDSGGRVIAPFDTDAEMRGILKALRTLPPANTEADVERVASDDDPIRRGDVLAALQIVAEAQCLDPVWVDSLHRSLCDVPALSLTRPAGGEEVEAPLLLRWYNAQAAVVWAAWCAADDSSDDFDPKTHVAVPNDSFEALGKALEELEGLVPADCQFVGTGALNDDVRAALTKPPALPTPRAYLKSWFVPGTPGERIRVDLSAECESWLAAYNPTITPLYDHPLAPPKEGEEVRLVERMKQALVSAFEYQSAHDDDFWTTERVVLELEPGDDPAAIGAWDTFELEGAVDLDLLARAALAALSSLPVRSGEVDGLADRFRDALERIPWVADRVRAGQQFNAYERASNDEDDKDEDLEFRIGIGPVTDFGSFADVTGRAKAELIEAALKIAALATPQQVKEGDRHG